jgi:GTP-binding protein EngB required for normal cell division
MTDLTILYSLRGTSTMSDVFVDAQLLRKQSSDTEGCFHRGMYMRAELIPVEPFVELVNMGYTLYLTGHSLGGSIASIITSRLLTYIDDKQKQSRIHCVTFGSPLCADEVFSSTITKKGYQNHFMHFIHPKDPIPLVLSMLKKIRTDYYNVEKRNNSDLTDKLRVLVKALFARDIEEYVSSLQGLWTKITANFDRSTLLTQFFSQLLEKIPKVDTQNVIDFLIPNFRPFGITLKIDHTELSYIKNDLIELQWNSFKDLLQLPKNADEFYQAVQQHKMAIYSLSIKEHLKYAYDDVYSVKSDHYQYVSKCELLDICTGPWKRIPDNNIASEITTSYTVFVTELTTENVAEVKITLHGKNMSLCRFASCSGAKRVSCEEKGSNNSRVSFVFITKLFICRNNELTVEVFSHFNNFEFKIHPPYCTEEVKTSKEMRIANLELVELYTLSQTYSLFVKERNPLTSNNNNDTHNQLPTSVGVERSQQSRLRVLNLLTEIESLWPEKDLQFPKNLILENSSKIDQKKTTDLWNEVMKLSDNSRQETPEGTDSMDVRRDITFPDEKKSITKVHLEFQKNKKMTTVQALSSSFPYLLALLNTIYERNITVDKTALEKIVSAGLAVLAVGGAVTATIATGGTALLFGAGAIGGGIGSYALWRNKAINTEYSKWLDMIASSLDIDTRFIRNNCMTYEKKIDAKVGTMLMQKSPEELARSWKDIFTQSPLYYLVPEERVEAIKIMKTICLQYQIRKELMESVAVGVVGEGNAGKSTLSYLLFECGSIDKCGILQRTLDIQLYYRTSIFHLIDFPHLDSAFTSIQSTFAANHKLVDALVFVINVRSEGSTSIAVNMMKLVQQVKVPYLVCFTHADELVQQDRNISASEIERRRKQYANDLLGPTEDINAIHLACFDDKYGVGDEVLEKAGIIGADYVRKWIIEKVLCEHLSISKQDVNVLYNYRHTRFINGKKRPEVQKIALNTMNNRQRRARTKVDLHPVLSNQVFQEFQRLGIQIGHQQPPSLMYRDKEMPSAIKYIFLALPETQETSFAWGDLDVSLKIIDIEKDWYEYEYLKNNERSIIFATFGTPNNEVEGLFVIDGNIQSNKNVDPDLFIVRKKNYDGPHKLSNILKDLTTFESVEST